MKKMQKPEIEFIRFNAEDVITTSGDPSVNKFATEPTKIIEDAPEGKSQVKNFVGLTWNNITQ